MPGLQLGDEEYQFCKLFVVEAAIHLAEMDFDLDIEGLRREQQKKAPQAQATQPDAPSN